MEKQVSLHEGQAWVSKIETFQMGTDFRGEALGLWRGTKEDQMVCTQRLP